MSVRLFVYVVHCNSNLIITGENIFILFQYGLNVGLFIDEEYVCNSFIYVND